MAWSSSGRLPHDVCERTRAWNHGADRNPDFINEGAGVLPTPARRNGPSAEPPYFRSVLHGTSSPGCESSRKRIWSVALRAALVGGRQVEAERRMSQPVGSRLERVNNRRVRQLAVP